ncbi:MFS transporter [bacterium]|nr:MFS transporter [bacterium]
MTANERKVILASAAGTIFEWYDFYLYGSLSSYIGAQFFTPFPEATQNIFALMAFATGFLVRPFGALFFGATGDMNGRKYAFLLTILIMGTATFLVGILPGYQTLGIAAPILLIVLRMAQGLALGGEYGGAAVYVAEHAPQNRRGYYTSYIQTTATMGMLLSLVVILVVTPLVNDNFPMVEQLGLDGAALRDTLGQPVTLDAWSAWGWRVPFILSAFLLLLSVYFRMTMAESPVYQKMQAEGAASKAPLREAFGHWRTAKIALIALFGLTAGQAVVWYTGQFFVLTFLKTVVKVDNFTANIFVACALVLGSWGFLFFGGLSDKIGRKPIILMGCFLAAISYFPVFSFITETANPALFAAQQASVTISADPKDCAFQFNPLGTAKFTTSCDKLKLRLLKNSVDYNTLDAPAGAIASAQIGAQRVVSFDGAAQAVALARAGVAVQTAERALDFARKGADPAAISSAEADLQAALAAQDKLRAVEPDFERAVDAALAEVGYPLDREANAYVARISNLGDMVKPQNVTVIITLTYLILLVTMVYGPIAAQLVELYPTRIRYSGLSLPYHIGNGWFGGLLPALVLAISAETGNIYSGLWYPVGIATLSIVVGALFVPNGTHRKSIFED